ncbi:MAG TPA: hypothetical protein VHF90_01120 [Thermoleophilaceae bacterium]|nr:hypothetical protein [Thermoleophilaceae bacterium]
MNRRRGLWLSGIVAAALLVVLTVVDGQIQDSGGPGIVAFELARTADRAAEILAEWGADGQGSARLSLWIDFPYLIAYGAFLALAVAAIRDALAARGRQRWARPGGAIAVLPIVAAACDVVEDVSLLLILDGETGSAAPAVAFAFALAKFVALAIALAYLLGGLVALAAARRRLA